MLSLVTNCLRVAMMTMVSAHCSALVRSIKRKCFIMMSDAMVAKGVNYTTTPILLVAGF